MTKNSFSAPIRSKLGEYLSLNPFLKETDDCITQLQKEIPWLETPRKQAVGILVCLDVYDVLDTTDTSATGFFKNILRQRYQQLSRLSERTFYLLFSFWLLQKTSFVYLNYRNIQNLKKFLKRHIKRYYCHSEFGKTLQNHYNNATYQESKLHSYHLYYEFRLWLHNNI